MFYEQGVRRSEAELEEQLYQQQQQTGTLQPDDGENIS